MSENTPVTTNEQEVQFICCLCHEANHLVMFPNVKEMSRADIWDGAEVPLKGAGWIVVGRPGVGEGRRCICPKCMDIQRTLDWEIAHLELFSGQSRCSKCGNKTCTSSYDAGHAQGVPVSGTMALVEHIVRVCKRCGYAWPQLCTDCETAYETFFTGAKDLNDNPGTAENKGNDAPSGDNGGDKRGTTSEKS